MKANKLMIGDWVMVNDIEHTHPLQVAEIFKKCGAYYATLYWDGMPDNVNPETLTADVDKVLPIHITPDILEKNGFVDERRNYAYRTDSYRVYYYCATERLSINKYFAILDAPCFYVHQLQHALRLCGIEKEIKL